METSDLLKQEINKTLENLHDFAQVSLFRGQSSGLSP